jgi:predicted DNA-binding antitoxin AbrB/MazE fold protein
MTLEAIYENGVFRPVDPVALEEGTRVQIFIDKPAGPADPKTVARLLAEVAALPLKGTATFSGEDHDSILYPTEHSV